MDVLDLIGKVIEFSEKGGEFSDEIKTIQCTLESLRLTVSQLGNNKLPAHLAHMLDENLVEAEDLLQQTAKQNSGSWFTNLRNMLPGSVLQKIKDKNGQLIHIISLINLHLNSIKHNNRAHAYPYPENNDDDFEPAKLKKLHTFQDKKGVMGIEAPKKSASDASYDQMMGPTIQDDDMSALEGPTQADNPEDTAMVEEDVSFRLRMLYNERLGKELKGKKDLEVMVEKKWEGNINIEYIFQRLNYAYLPMDDVKRLSRDHAKVMAIKKAPTGSNGKASTNKLDIAMTATVADDGYLGATVADDADGNGYENGDGGKNEYILKDLSLNGTYYLKGTTLKNFPPSGMKIVGDFQHLKKDEEVHLEHGDIIGLIMLKPHCNELIFGFQLLID